MSQEVRLMGSILCPEAQQRERTAYLSQEVKGEAIFEPIMTHLGSVQNGTNMPTRQMQNGTKIPVRQNGTNMPKGQPNASFAGGGVGNALPVNIAIPLSPHQRHSSSHNLTSYSLIKSEELKTSSHALGNLLSIYSLE